MHVSHSNTSVKFKSPETLNTCGELLEVPAPTNRGSPALQWEVFCTIHGKPLLQ